MREMINTNIWFEKIKFHDLEYRYFSINIRYEIL